MPERFGFRDDGIATEELMERLEKAEAEVNEYKEMLQRTQADFMNYKRRVEEERSEQVKRASAQLIDRLLPVIDDFGRAIEAVPQEQCEVEWMKGVTLIERKLVSILEQEGLTRVGEVGDSFDPSQHEAVMVDESNRIADGRITRVMQEGYKLNGKLLRPARVAVGRARGNM